MRHIQDTREIGEVRPSTSSSAPHTLLNLKPSDSWTKIETGKAGVGPEEWKGFSLVVFRKDLKMKSK